MFYSLLLTLLIALTYIYEMYFVEGRKVYKEVYKKDFSEYCRRQVVPSVFLGREVAEANSQILHFSKLELPYSCLISVRSESGSNIILVIEFSSHKNLISSCAKDSNQLLVYEMGETFGGYWGPLPNPVINQDIEKTVQYYTMKTTPSLQHIDPNIDNDNDYGESLTSMKSETTIPEHSLIQSNDYIEEEVPLVNVSGMLFPSVSPRSAVDINSIFDTAYDVSSRSGVSYDTTILPLIQFSAINDVGIRRNKDESKYQIDFNIDLFPIDVNLIPPKIPKSKKGKLYRKYKYNSNKLFNLKANNRTIQVMQTLSNLTTPRDSYHLTTTTRLDYAMTRQLTANSKSFPKINNTEKTLSWDLIHTLLKNLNKTYAPISTEISPASANMSHLLPEISEMKHNFSVYLSPNLFTAKKKLKFKQNQDKATKIPSNTYFSSYQHDQISGTVTSSYRGTTLATEATRYRSKAFGISSSESYTKDNMNESKLINLNNGYGTEQNILAATHPYIASSIFNNSKNSLRGSLVNRESWENIVQIAPVMADVLSLVNSNKSGLLKTKISKRKKKHIKSISINKAKPHKMATSKEVYTTTIASHLNEDMQEFTQLVEIPDDEIQGRVALRYLRHYVGPLLLNVCSYEEALTRNVYIFNSSRIILAINNFTIDKMTVVVTPAHILLTSKERCVSTQFECQVSGARVCIDSLTACDGVPNCGSYDIYDEDRLMCGGAVGLQHNVGLAAFTFLAVLLTLLYTLHYWLKRCVPKVSDAFFIYTDGFENMLYLDSIMRNPNDDVDNSKALYQPNMFENDLLCPVLKEDSRKSRILIAIKCIVAVCTCYFCKGKNNDTAEHNINYLITEPKRMYSFTKLEIDKMLCNNLTETAVQTGDSFEMAHLKNKITNNEYRRNDEYQKSQEPYKTCSLLALSNSSLHTAVIMKQIKKSDELSIIKLLNDSRSSSYTLRTNTTPKIKGSTVSSTAPEERELRSHDYEQQNKKMTTGSTGGSVSTKSDIHKKKTLSARTKHLRFKEDANIIPAALLDIDDIGRENDTGQRRSVLLGTRRFYNAKSLDAIEEVHEHGSSSIRFWGKSKKSKKPQI